VDPPSKVDSNDRKDQNPPVQQKPGGFFVALVVKNQEIGFGVDNQSACVITALETMQPTHRKKIGSGMRNETAGPLKKAEWACKGIKGAEITP